MFELITKSKIRQKIILLFIYHSEKEYYINEVAKLVKTSSGTAQRELEKLISSSFLTKEKKANLVYFKIAKGNPLFADLKNIVEKTIGLEYVLKHGLERENDVDFSFLFGSYVKRDIKPDSDIDLYVIGKINEDKLHKMVVEAEKKIGRDINYHLSDLGEFKKNLKKSFFHKEIIKNSLLLTGDEKEFRKLIGGASERGKN